MPSSETDVAEDLVSDMTLHAPKDNVGLRNWGVEVGGQRRSYD